MRPLLLATVVASLLFQTPVNAEPLAHLPRTFAGDAHLLVDRDEAWRAIIGLIDGAQRSICVDYYLLGGPRAEEMADHLAAKQKEGVVVRVLLDPDMGTLPVLRAMTQPVLNKLQVARIPVRFYPRDTLGRVHSYRYVEDHDKVVIADGCHAFTGSMNFGAELLHNHDVCVGVDGQVAHAMMDDVLTAFALATPLGPEDDRPWPAASLPDHLGDAEITYIPTGLTGTPARAALLNAITKAQKAIRVMMFEFEDDAVAEALMAAEKRGVDVRVMVDPNNLGQLSPIGWCPSGVFNLRLASRLTVAGLPVRWYMPDTDHRMLHAKAALIDDTLFAGSTNWNHFSFDLNNEVMLAIHGGSASGRFADQFDQDWNARGTPIVDVPSLPRVWFYAALAYMLN